MRIPVDISIDFLTPATATVAMGEACWKAYIEHKMCVRWVITPALAWRLRTLRDGNENYMFADEMKAGFLFGVPFTEGYFDGEMYLLAK